MITDEHRKGSACRKKNRRREPAGLFAARGFSDDRGCQSTFSIFHHSWLTGTTLQIDGLAGAAERDSVLLKSLLPRSSNRDSNLGRVWFQVVLLALHFSKLY